ncbi:MAG: hypothetical protein LBV67_08325 [Streptococcaceae bacterium]|jgi:hypothetical protein|nr:hypothetical protein [Streptococcaceae bacterium]
MVKNAIDSSGFESVTGNVRKSAAKVAGVRNGLSTNDAHLKVEKIETIFHLYDDLSKLISSYGRMVEHDVEEFQQLGRNMKKTDMEASS